MKKGLFGLLVLLMLSVGVSSAFAEDSAPVIVKSDMKLALDGQPLALDEAYLINDSLFVPYRAFAEGIGGEVQYDEATKEVTVLKGETTVKFIIGSADATVNGVSEKMVGPSTLIGDFTFVHSRFLAETFGITVQYDENTRSVNLVTGVVEEEAVKTYTIEMSNFAFVQNEITVEVGSKITFTNKDKMEHDAVADDGSFKIDLIGQGESATITLDKPGVYTYYCTPHKKFMTGTITVK
jgi:plastocyanin